LRDKVIENGGEAVVAYPISRSNLEHYNKNDILIGSRIERNFHRILAYLTGFNGCFSTFSTIRLIKKIKKFNPDIIHIHNLHNCYINIPIIFRFIKKENIKVIWTLHDCWSFTGQCPNFILAKCDKWKKGCSNCSQIYKYPKALVDRTKEMWKIKKDCFCGVNRMLIVTPSQWLKTLVKESFLKDYTVEVINNGINMDIFKPMPKDNELLYKIGGNGKHIVLGVSFSWSYEKGLDIFCKLSERLDNNYLIVLVGTNNEVDKMLPKSIVSIHETKNQYELTKFYSLADVFVNATRQDNYPTVNLEAAACGIPVITFDSGGSSETVLEGYGRSIDGNIDELIECIREYCEDTSIDKYECARKARVFDKKSKFQKYIEYYKNGWG
jgi:glycosyltransferase involved in cell wall biosynthesis